MQYSVVFALDGFALKEACLFTNAHELLENTQLYLLPPLEGHLIDYGSEEEGCECLHACVCHCVCHYVYMIFMKEHTHITLIHFPLVVPFVR